MRRVVTAEQMRQADAYTIAQEPIASIDLMERAASACSDWILARFPVDLPFVVMAGMGNNGGDGLAIARQLFKAGRTVRVMIIQHREAGSPDFQANLERLDASIERSEIKDGSMVLGVADREVVVDALLGTGLDRPLTGILREIVLALNKLPNVVIAIDMPSGMSSEAPTADQPVVQADHTLTFEWPKLTFMLPENLASLGELHILPIGLLEDPASKDRADMLEVDEQDARELLPVRPPAGHKGTFGHALLMAGSTGKMGAAVIAARACARSGPGLVTAYVPAGQAEDALAAVPEAMFLRDPSPNELTELPLLEGYAAIGVGPGIGTGTSAARVIKGLIQLAPCPLVLDADALNILAENKTWLAFLPPGSILTPHPKEFDRMTEKSTTSYERLTKARDFARRYGVVLVLKGAHTAIISPSGRVFFNPTGNAGMAKGGSGDALTGIITALRAQQLDHVSAAVLGVYAHGAAGDIAAAELGQDGMLPTDLIERLPKVWMRLRSEP